MKRAWWVRAGWLVRGCKDRGCHGQETLRAPHERICRDVLSLRSLPRVLARLLVYQPVRFRNYFYASPSKAAAVARGVYICARISRGSATSRRCISRRPASLSYAILRISRGDARGALLPLGSLPGLDLATRYDFFPASSCRCLLRDASRSGEALYACMRLRL